MGKGSANGGKFLIALGVIFLLLKYVFHVEFFSFGPGDFWPLIVLLIGVAFELGFFVSGRSPGLLVPGGILTTIGMLFFFEVSTNWIFSDITWPVYILAVAVGLYQLYLYGGRRKGLLIPVYILTAVAAISLLCIGFDIIVSKMHLSTVIPVVLIVAGIYMYNKNKNKIDNNW